MQKEYTFSIDRYLEALDESFASGKMSYFKTGSSFPSTEMLIYTMALVVMAGVGQMFEIVLALMPLTALIFLGHMVYSLRITFKNRRMGRKISKSYLVIRNLTKEYSKITIRPNGLEIEVELSKADGTILSQKIGSNEMTLLDMGMDKYVEIHSKDHKVMIPRTLFKTMDFVQISKPYWEVTKLLQGRSKLSGDGLENLRAQIPTLIQTPR